MEQITINKSYYDKMVEDIKGLYDTIVLRDAEINELDRIIKDMGDKTTLTDGQDMNDYKKQIEDPKEELSDLKIFQHNNMNNYDRYGRKRK